jgi:uncharacterized protein (TIGR03118 family)
MSLFTLPTRKAPGSLSGSPARCKQKSLAAALVTTALFASAANAQSNAYTQTNLISDVAGSAAITNKNLVNPWGLSIGTDFWIDTAGTGLSLVTSATGVSSFNVSIPSATGTGQGSPAGTVFNADNTVFDVPNSSGGASASFLFGTLDGTIAAWNSSTTQAVTVVNNSASHASYTDIVIDANTTGTFLLAANFASGKVDIFDKNFNPATLTGSFTDPALPTGYAPFGIHNIGGKIYVTYAQVNASTGRETVGASLGYVDVFDNNGNLISEAIAQGVLNAPWGMALAPSGFGSFAGDLLVGNFGDGTINAYDPTSFAFKGTLEDSTGAPITNSGLWEIVFGTSNTGGAGDPNTLYLAAGINNEADGLVAAITAAQSSSGSSDFSFSAPSGSLSVTSQTPGTLSFSLAGSNGFSGAVSFSCSNLPSNVSCSFSPTSIQLSGSTASSVMLTVTESAAAAPPPPPPPPPTGYIQHSRLVGSHLPYTLAFLAPLGLFGLTRLRRRSIKALLLVATVALIGFGVTGCSSSSPQAGSNPVASSPQPTTAQITVNAMSGSITHSTTVTVNLD